MVKSRENALSIEQLRKVLSKCQNFYEYFLIRTLSATGMRIGEFLHFNKGWIDYEAEPVPMIRIPRKMKCGNRCGYCKNKKWEYEYRLKYKIKSEKTKEKLLKEDNYLNGWWISKTPEAQRSIPIISETLLKLFEKFFSKHKFCWEYYWDKPTCWKMCREIGKRAGIVLTPHVLRATCASIMAQLGASEATLTAVMGWTTIMPAIHYLKTSGRRAAEELSKIKEKYGDII